MTAYLFVGLIAAVVAGVLGVLLRRWPHSLLVQVAVTALLTLAVLLAIAVVWSALWWLVQRWGA